MQLSTQLDNHFFTELAIQQVSRTRRPASPPLQSTGRHDDGLLESVLGATPRSHHITRCDVPQM